MISKFRTWIHELWLQNCDEHIEYGEPPLPQDQYFKMYKYWLKREFKHQQKPVESNFVTGFVLDDKLDYTTISLLSDNQNKLITTLKDNNEK